MATTPIVLSSQYWATSSPVRWKRFPSNGTMRGSTSQYRQNFSQHTWTFAPITMLGFVGRPSRPAPCAVANAT